VLAAIEQAEFDQLLDPLNDYLQAYRSEMAAKRAAKKAAAAQADSKDDDKKDENNGDVGASKSKTLVDAPPANAVALSNKRKSTDAPTDEPETSSPASPTKRARVDQDDNDTEPATVTDA
jgi:hypothetical protein